MQKNIAHFFNTGFSPIFDDGNKILGTFVYEVR